MYSADSRTRVLISFTALIPLIGASLDPVFGPVMVLGAGVAGLQAIATAKRLGAVVTGFDIRRAAWEQIASLGGRPLELDFIPDAEAEGGYARPLTAEESAEQQRRLAEHLRTVDVIVTTSGPSGVVPAP